MSDRASAAADGILALINSRPRTPAKEELEAFLRQAFPAAAAPDVTRGSRDERQLRAFYVRGVVEAWSEAQYQAWLASSEGAVQWAVNLDANGRITGATKRHKSDSKER